MCYRGWWVYGNWGSQNWVGVRHGVRICANTKELLIDMILRRDETFTYFGKNRVQ